MPTHLRAVTLDPTEVEARLVLAGFLLDEGQPGRALEVAASASQLAPGNPRARDLVERARGATRTGG
jgi:uncharacterized protein (TIGR02996 family)